MGAVVGPIFEEETEAEGGNVVYSESHPTPFPGEQLGSVESGPHQQGSLRRTVPGLGPMFLAGISQGQLGGWVGWGGGSCPEERFPLSVIKT